MGTKNKLVFLSLIVCALFFTEFATAQNSQLTLAVMDFKNSSGRASYDRLERAVAEMLKTELSQSRKIVLLERKKIEAILSEYALAQAGYIEPEHALEVGKLAGAEYIITGEIQWMSGNLRLDAHLIRVSTGQILGEKVTGSSQRNLPIMIHLLAQNIVFDLTGQGLHVSERKIKNYKVIPAAGISGALALVTLIYHLDYRKNYDSYHQATQFDEFDRYYDRANRSHKIRNWFMAATAACLTTTFVLWRADKSRANRVFAASHSPSRQFADNISLAIQPWKDALSVSVLVRF